MKRPKLSPCQDSWKVGRGSWIIHRGQSKQQTPRIFGRGLSIRLRFHLQLHIKNRLRNKNNTSHCNMTLQKCDFIFTSPMPCALTSAPSAGISLPIFSP